MKILVTGADGMLGSALCPELRRRGHELIATTRFPRSAQTSVLDVSDLTAVVQTLKTTQPTLVIHLAAETDVDRCEQDPAHAYVINAAGTEHIVHACARIGTRLLYLSTAGVFDGQKPTPYVETDTPNPVNVYGRTKLAGESAVRQHAGLFQIVRAGWMVGGYELDKKFIGKLLRLLETTHELTVVTDKLGSLTFTEDLSRGIAMLIETDHGGVFHMANEGFGSRYDVACKLVELLRRDDVTIRPITSDAFPLPAPRAPSEAVENRRLRELGLNVMPSWEQALARYVQRYLDTVNPSTSSR